MTAVVLLVLGLFLCFLEAASTRFAHLVAGFCGALLVALALVGRSVQARRAE